MEVRPFGVKVVVIEPGDHKTAITANRTEMSGGTDAYNQSFQAALERTARDEQSGPGPEHIAHLLYRIVNTRDPRLRYTIGPATQRAAVWLKRLLPYSVTEYSMRSYFGLGG
jgi:NAD(P)-dependent dehydrogenase (short-subunit alcohol dehydrogenase family)